MLILLQPTYLIVAVMHYLRLFPNIIQELHRRPLLLCLMVLYLWKLFQEVSSISVSSIYYFLQKPSLSSFFSNEIYKKERGATLVGILTLDVPPSLGHLDLAMQVLGTRSK